MKLFWNFQKKVTLPIRWKYQKMQVIDSVVYPTPKELVEKLEEIQKQLPKLARSVLPEYHYLKGQQDLIEEILYGRL